MYTLSRSVVTDGISMIDIFQAIRLDFAYTKLLHAIQTEEWNDNDLRDFYNVRNTLDTKSRAVNSTRP